jgi:hypothetical protein
MFWLKNFVVFFSFFNRGILDVVCHSYFRNPTQTSTHILIFISDLTKQRPHLVSHYKWYISLAGVLSLSLSLSLFLRLRRKTFTVMPIKKFPLILSTWIWELDSLHNKILTEFQKEKLLRTVGIWLKREIFTRNKYWDTWLTLKTETQSHKKQWTTHTGST